MTAKDAIKNVVETCHMLTHTYVDDLNDADWFVRPVPGANHVAWQLGHLIASDNAMLAMLGRKPLDLAPDFAAAHTTETASSDDSAKFLKKREYLALMDKSKATTLAAIDATAETELDQPAPEAARAYAPTVGALLLMLGTHWLMHAGQFVPLRRKLGRPPLF